MGNSTQSGQNRKPMEAYVRVATPCISKKG